MIKNLISNKNILIWILAIIPVFVFYYKIILNPNDILLNPQKDGIKNYYVYKYYIDNNKSFSDFEGMNYPYGENFIYTDSQPPVAFTVKIISKIFPGIKNIDFAIMHYFILFSFVFSIFLFFKIFEYLKIDFVFSILGAWAVVLLSPQFLRIYGHYSLSYSFMFPLVIYFLLNTKRQKLSNLIIFITSLFVFFLHPYIGLSLFMFTILVSLFKLIFISDFKIKRFAINIIIQSILPLILFFISSLLLDSHVNRSTNPAGIYYYHSYLKTIFIASFEPIKSFYKIFIHFNEQPFEGIAYIGIISNLMILFIIGLGIKKIIRKKYKLPFDKNLTIFLFSSVILLLFSFGIPHVYPFPKLLDIVPYLRQFRSLGRFSWFFYYSINIFTIFVLFYFYNKFKNNKIISNIFTFLLLMFLTEGILYQKNITNNKFNVNNKFDLKITKQFQDIKSVIDTKKYQAIIPIPFYHVGSEDFAAIGSPESLKNSMLLSYHLNLPILGSMGSRTSIDETKKSLSILLPQFFRKSIMDDISDKRDFLLISSQGNKTDEEKLILSNSKLILKSDGFNLYSITYNDLFEYKKYKNQIISQYNLLNDSLHQKQGFVLSDTSKYFKFEDFDNKSTSIKCYGLGSKAIKKNKPAIIFKIKVGELKGNKSYILSFWTYNKGYGRTSFQVIWEEHNKITGKSNWHYSTDARFAKLIKNNWSLIEFNFKPENDSINYNLYLPGRNNGIDSIYIDNILIREADLDIYKKLKDNKLLYNNYILEQ